MTKQGGELNKKKIKIKERTKTNKKTCLVLLVFFKGFKGWLFILRG